MASDYSFADEEMIVDENVGFPRAYAKLCRDRGSGPYGQGPPLTFTPYSLQDNEAMRARDLDQYFPIIDPKSKRTANPRIFVSLLWKQLSHLGNAGFDPAVIRVDPYGNVLYYHADSASPLAWEIDHWFPCSRGGLTVPSNLRILQWQASKKKHNKLEFLIPWWDFQIGISVNQFMSFFASSNSDFRHRAFSFLFADGENEELNSGQTVESHSFPQHFVESKEKQGLAPAAIVASRRDFNGSSSSSSILQSVDHNRLRSRSPAIGGGRVSISKENENPYQAIVTSRDSFRQRDEALKLKNEATRLDEEVSEMRRWNEEEKMSIQDLEMALVKRRRRAEKCRRLAEAQSSYKTMLEKMIRDAMHQSVVYKEQVRLNQAASSALVARLEAQKAICDSSEKDLYKKYMKRDELEKQIRPELDQGRKRSRTEDEDRLGALVDREEEHEEQQRQQKTVIYLPSTASRPRTPLHKELRVYLEEEQKGSDTAGEDETRRRSLIKKSEHNFSIDKRREDRGKGKAIVVSENEQVIKQTSEEKKEQKIRFPTPRVSDKEEKEEDEETRTERGKGNVEKWLQMLLEKSGQEEYFYEENEPVVTTNKSDDIIKKMNLKYPKKEEAKNSSETKEIKVVEERRHQSVGKERKVARCESSRVLRRIPSSPMIILGMKKGADCIGKKPMVNSDNDDDEAHVTANNSFLRSSLRTIKKAVKM